MTPPDRENTLSLLTEWQAHYTAVSSMMDNIKTSTGLDIDGALCTIVWELFDAYTEAAGMEVGDHDGWMSWYCWDNDMGALAMAAGYDGKPRPIRTLKNLCTLIFESRKRANE